MTELYTIGYDKSAKANDAEAIQIAMDWLCSDEAIPDGETEPIGIRLLNSLVDKSKPLQIIATNSKTNHYDPEQYTVYINLDQIERARFPDNNGIQTAPTIESFLAHEIAHATEEINPERFYENDDFRELAHDEALATTEWPKFVTIEAIKGRVENGQYEIAENMLYSYVRNVDIPFMKRRDTLLQADQEYMSNIDEIESFALYIESQVAQIQGVRPRAVWGFISDEQYDRLLSKRYAHFANIVELPKTHWRETLRPDIIINAGKVMLPVSGKIGAEPPPTDIPLT